MRSPVEEGERNESKEARRSFIEKGNVSFVWDFSNSRRAFLETSFRGLVLAILLWLGEKFLNFFVVMQYTLAEKPWNKYYICVR